MDKSRSVRLTGQQQRDYAKYLVDHAPEGWVVKIAAETRRDAQNRKLWPMIADIRKQVPGFDAFSADDIKNRFLNALGVEMRFLPELEGQGVFPVGMRSSTLTVAQFAGLIELISEFGARKGVKWSEPTPYQ
jgi:hypothetical protein